MAPCDQALTETQWGKWNYSLCSRNQTANVAISKVELLVDLYQSLQLTAESHAFEADYTHARGATRNAEL